MLVINSRRRIEQTCIAAYRVGDNAHSQVKQEFGGKSFVLAMFIAKTKDLIFLFVLLLHAT